MRAILGLGVSAAIDDHAIKSREMHLQYAVSADRAMYEAKRRGKGGFVIHAPHAEGVSLVPSAEADSEFAAERQPWHVSRSPA